jgi:hypothetical protein
MPHHTCAVAFGSRWATSWDCWFKNVIGIALKAVYGLWHILQIEAQITKRKGHCIQVFLVLRPSGGEVVDQHRALFSAVP